MEVISTFLVDFIERNGYVPTSVLESLRMWSVACGTFCAHSNFLLYVSDFASFVANGFLMAKPAHNSFIGDIAKTFTLLGR